VCDEQLLQDFVLLTNSERLFMSCFMPTKPDDFGLDVLDVLLFSLSMIAGITLAF
jgi:hypothetical protein